MIQRILLLAFSLALALPVSAARLKDLASIGGVRDNQLIGYGLVVGLDGSGDKGTSTPYTTQSLGNMLNQLGVQIPQGLKLDPKNVAAVSLTATLPPFARAGQKIDVTASSIGDAKSLRGGTLLMSPLKGADGQIYAIAQGSLIVGGAGAQAGGSSAKVNHLSVGRVPAGATVEREVPTQLSGPTIAVELLDADFGTASNAVDAINRALGPVARAIDARLIEVSAPQDSNARVRFVSRLENIAVTAAKASPLVIVNARTGSIVMNQAVTLEPCAVAHGNLSVTVSNTPEVSQPNALAGGQTVVTNQANIDIKAQGGKVIEVPRGTDLAKVVAALNALGAGPQDLIAILQAMKAAGALKAELEII
ncbi:flagellar basal body P-ring protein FlgI [Crenobacter intestini]|uniref:flagellar basal body P-ring protein FlgI n=1 Tax=Crenobacter intestini TaxID=2563443 RepID=UPI00196A85B7|nr:flagellar basal body P-ring protein FlgI [Crenobacter intestini]